MVADGSPELAHCFQRERLGLARCVRDAVGLVHIRSLESLITTDGPTVHARPGACTASRKRSMWWSRYAVFRSGAGKRSPAGDATRAARA
jgi:hypothetical protein